MAFDHPRNRSGEVYDPFRINQDLVRQDLCPFPEEFESGVGNQNGNQKTDDRIRFWKTPVGSQKSGHNCSRSKNVGSDMQGVGLDQAIARPISDPPFEIHEKKLQPHRY